MSRSRWMCLGLAALAVLYLVAAPIADAYAPKGRSGSGSSGGGGAEPDVAFLTPGESGGQSGSDAGSQTQGGGGPAVGPTEWRPTLNPIRVPAATQRGAVSDVRSGPAPLERQTLLAAWLQLRLGLVVYLMTLPR